MKSSNTKRKIADLMVGAAVGAAIAGPAGAVAGGLVGSQVAAHTPRAGADGSSRKQPEPEAEEILMPLQFKRILVPLDFSAPSLRTLRLAGEWAARFGAEICLLHVVESINTIGLFGAEPIAALPPPVDYRAQVRAELERLARAEFPDATAVSVHLRDGSAFDQIASAARELEADLIIIATHGRTGLTHALLGSMAERVVRHAPCPVLTLRRAR